MKFGDYVKERYVGEIPQNSNWYEFSDIFHLGKLEMDTFAELMGYRDFKDLDMSISPESLYDRDRNKFVDSLETSSVLDTSKIKKGLTRFFM